MNDEEKSASGAPIYRYTEENKKKEFELAIGDNDSIEAISDHIEKHLGKVEMVYHELISHLVHVDVHWVKPSEALPFHILVTSGMSDKPMNAPQGAEDFRYAEVCVLLPPDWPLVNSDQQMNKDERSYWPIRWLKIVSRFPHDFNTWLGWGHTLPNGADAEPFADNTKFGCMLLLPPLSLPRDFLELKINEEKSINFYCLIPLYKEEMNYKMEKGVDALVEKIPDGINPEIIDINRPNVCKKKGLFGLW